MNGGGVTEGKSTLREKTSQRGPLLSNPWGAHFCAASCRWLKRPIAPYCNVNTCNCFKDSPSISRFLVIWNPLALPTP